MASLVGVAPDVGLDELEEDSSVENGEENSGLENGEEDSIEYGSEGDKLGVVDRLVAVELRGGVVRDEGSPGRVPSLTIK